MSDSNSIGAAVQTVIDSYPVGYQFHGNQLKADVVKIYPDAQYCYTDTVLRKARLYRRDTFRAINRNISLYEKIESILDKLRAVREAAEKDQIEKRQALDMGQLTLFKWENEK